MWLSVMLARLVFGLLDLVFHFYVVCSCLYIKSKLRTPPPLLKKGGRGDLRRNGYLKKIPPTPLFFFKEGNRIFYSLQVSCV